jgi:hypothetical protein
MMSLMELTVVGTKQATGQYLHLWGFYVRGFKPWHHCFACFFGTQEKLIHKQMQDASVLLPEPTSYFYLCGVASGSRALRGRRNLHLAVRPKQGSTATIRSFYGPIFTVRDAEEIVIQDPIESMPELDESYTRCKNFRFAAQMYEATSFGPAAPRTPIRTPRNSSLL